VRAAGLRGLREAGGVASLGHRLQLLRRAGLGPGAVAAAEARRPREEAARAGECSPLPPSPQKCLEPSGLGSAVRARG
jgi:hypothetical protein